MVAKIVEALKNKEYCPEVFLDVSQAFDRVWHDSLIHKLKKTLSESYSAVIRSYIEQIQLSNVDIS